jgi:glutamyl-tRNA reductase
VRRAFDAARAAGATSRALDAVFSSALVAGRRVRSETTLGRHPISVSGAAAAFAAEWAGGLGGRHVAVLGAGEAAEGMLRALHGSGVGRVTLVARNPERAAVLAAAWGCEDVRPWPALASALAEADVLVAATAAPHPLVTGELVAGVLPLRGGRPLLAIDLCVPRNVAPELARLPGVALADLDGLQRRSCPVGADADGGQPFVAAERIIADELARLGVRLRAMEAAPGLAELHRLGERLVEEELAEALARLPALGAAEQAVVRAMAERLVRRVMYPVSRAMRHADAPTPMPVHAPEPVRSP